VDADVRICGVRATPGRPARRLTWPSSAISTGNGWCGSFLPAIDIPLARIPRGCFNAAARESVGRWMVAIALHGLPLFDHSHGVQEILMREGTRR
jgi:hypothetical protein